MNISSCCNAICENIYFSVIISVMESRTNKTLKNAKVALFFYVANLLLSFISRKIFISYLGSEILGLNTTIVNLLSFLNLAELGIGAAVSYALYSPLFVNDKRTINEIVSLQGWLYRKIGFLLSEEHAYLCCFSH